MDQRDLAGAVAGLATAAALHLVPSRARLTVAAGGLVAASLVYPFCSLVDRHAIALHAVWGILFVAGAWASRRRAFVLGALWMLHVAWDAIAQAHGGVFPSWYPASCRGFDLVFGLVVMLRGGAWPNARSG